MAYAHKVTRVTMFGTMFGGAEEWSTGFFLGSVGGDAPAPTQAGADAIKGYWQTFFTAANSHISGDWKTEGVKLALFNTDGHTDLDNVKTSFYATPISGGEGGGSLPPQVSLSAQLASDVGRGLAAKGRMYLPGVRTPISSTTGKIGATEAGQIALTLKTFLDAVNGSIDAAGTVVLASKGRITGGGAAPVNAVVTKVRVGDVYDTQRRRRNGLTETYQTQTIVP